MYGTPNSDVNFTMAASQAFEGIINQVVSSNLDFCLEQSPFSVIIHLKKSVIKNKSGTLPSPPPTLSVQPLQVQSDNFRQAQKIINLESVIKSFKRDSDNRILELERELEREKLKVDQISETETKKFEHKVMDLEEKVINLTEMGTKKIALN
jgi:hypothetical protein